VLNTENPPNKGEVLVVINPSFFSSYKEEIEKMKKEVMYPGKHGNKIREERLRDGIPIDETLLKTLQEMKEKVPYYT